MNTQTLKVGLGSCGIAAGAQDVYNYFSKDMADGRYSGVTLTKTSCLGLCFAEPIVEVHDKDTRIVYGNVDMKFARKILDGIANNRLPEEKRILDDMEVKKYTDGQVKLALRNCGIIDPESIEEYMEKGGYSALKKACTEMEPQTIIDVLKESGLRGRGGAGFLTGQKWEFLKKAAGEVK